MRSKWANGGGELDRFGEFDNGTPCGLSFGPY